MKTVYVASLAASHGASASASVVYRGFAACVPVEHYARIHAMNALFIDRIA